MIRTLRVVEQAQAAEPGVAALAAAMSVDASTASRLVDTAVAAGYVSRQTSVRDRRRSVLRLTPEGSALLDEATAVRTALLAELTDGWPPADVATLSALLERLAVAIPGGPSPT
jgi:DNA-binding MarR family transcriptional regulator